jgi:uncharacterized lipoprotein YajG
MRYLILTTFAILAACSTPSTVSPLSIPLQYKTMATVAEFPTLQTCAALSKVEVVDARDEKNLGKRYVEGKTAANAIAPVTASNDVRDWVQTGVEAALKRSGVTIGNASAPVLKVTIEQITTAENVLHRSGYEGHITLAGDLHPASGASCWNGRAEGSSENYGYAGSVENYQETLNHALDRAVIKILTTPEMKKAICACGG